MFLRTLCDLSYSSVPNRPFHFKLYMYLDYGIDSGFASDILSILAKYNLSYYLPRYVQILQFPGKLSWKRIVSSAISQHEHNLWRSRMDRDQDFTRFKRLQLYKSSASIYNMDVIIKDKRLIVTLAKRWVMKPSLICECHLCGSVGPDILFHFVGECQYTKQQVIWSIISSLRDLELR